MTSARRVITWAIVGVALAYSVPVASAQAPLSEEDALKLGTEAYIYGYPLVTMEMTRRVMTNVSAASGKFAPMGQFANLRTYPGPNDKEVTAPNADTLYSLAWIDLSKEPYVVTIPDEHGRYFLMPMLSAWTDVFEVPGTRTTGTKAQKYVITGPTWKGGKLPEDVEEIKSPTSLAWILTRTFCTGTPQDYKAVHAIQDQYSLVPLSAFGKPYTAPPGKVDPSIDMKTPVRDQVNRLGAAAYFKLLASLMKDNPPAEDDAPAIASMAKLGVFAGRDFDINKLGVAAARGLERAPKAAQAEILGHFHDAGELVNGWQILLNTGDYGTDYLQRAFVTAVGLGANLAQDAIYPTSQADAEGKKYHGSHNYVLHFAEGQDPPVNGFWSLTMYDGEYFLVSNRLNRHSVSPRNALKRNDDGSLDLYIQNGSPGKDKESNWLPAPKGEFKLMLRMYWPDAEILDGSWTPSAVTRSDRLADAKAIEALGEAFAKAYEKGDAEAIAALFTEEAEVTDEEGQIIRGRDAIGEQFAAGFQARPGDKIELTTLSLRFLGPDIAREHGVTRTIPAGKRQSETTRYDAILVQRDGHWLHASVHELPAKSPTAHERLEELEWLLGDWVDESGEGVVHTTCRWSDDKSFLLRDFTVQVAGQPTLSGSQRIGWDPQSHQFKSWVFDPDGGFSEAVWSRNGKDQWIIKASGVLADGRSVSGTQVLTYVNKGAARWRSVDRAIGGEAVDDLDEIVIVRTPPKPASSPSVAK
jgi:uncharacterized protein (TIGR02246 family)